MFIPWQQQLQSHHLEQFQQQHGSGGPTLAEQWALLQHAPAAGAAGIGGNSQAVQQGLDASAIAGVHPLLHRSSSLLRADMQHQQQQQQQVLLSPTPGASSLTYQLTAPEASLLAAGAAAGLPPHPTAAAFFSPPGTPLSRQQQQQQLMLQSQQQAPKQHQGQGQQRQQGQQQQQGRRRGRGRGGLPSGSGGGGSGGALYPEVSGGMDLASNSSILRTSSGKVLRWVGDAINAVASGAWGAYARAHCKGHACMDEDVQRVVVVGTFSALTNVWPGT
jgi:hypothetical protein